MERIRISGKDLGVLSLPSFCPRCFWVRLHCKLPFQAFPGVFSPGGVPLAEAEGSLEYEASGQDSEDICSGIDTYTRKITSLHFRQKAVLPVWFARMGLSGEPVKVPHPSKFNITDPDTNIQLTGLPDEILFQQDDNSYFILDYKTARRGGCHDALLPIYDVQLNACAYIAERMGFAPVKGLGLLYYEPFTEISSINHLTLPDGFFMQFISEFHSLDLNPAKIPPLLKKVRDLHDQPQIPEGRPGCPDCKAINELLKVVQ
jgi:hypothetical protein